MTEVVWTGGGGTTTTNKQKQKNFTSHLDILQMMILEGQTFALHTES